VNQDSRASSPSVAEVKIHDRPRRPLRVAGAQHLGAPASAMSSGDSTSRNWAADIDPAHRPERQCRAERRGALRQQRARSCSRTKSGAISLTVASAAIACSQADCSSANPCSHGSGGTDSGAGPTQRSQRAGGAASHHEPQVARRPLQARYHGLPVDQAPRQLQGRPPARRGRNQQLAGAQLRAPEELHAGFIELVRLVEDRDAHRSAAIRPCRIRERQVGKEQVVVDHHHIGRERFAARRG
jgi:hypothetical protein